MKTAKELAKSARLKAMFKNPEFKDKHQTNLQKAIDDRVASPNWDSIKEKIKKTNVEFRKENPRTEEEKYACGNNMRGKTLEEILGEERAAEGRRKRSETQRGVPQPPGTGEKIAATRRERGSYDGRSMRDKKHKESTKEIMALKAQVRQDLKRKLGLGRDGKIPKELLEKEYKKRGL